MCMIPGSLLFDFPRKQKIGSVSIPEAVNPLPADNVFAGRGAIGWREQLYAVGKGFIPEFHEAQWRFVPECKVLQNAVH